MELVETLLRELGFESNATAVLHAFIEHGELSAREVAQMRKLPRSTCYAILEQLAERGILVSSGARGSRYKIAGPAAFSNIVLSEKERLSVKERAAHQLSNLFSLSQESAAGVPKLQFCTGKRDIEVFLNSRLSSWRESLFLSDSTWWGYQDDAFVDQYLRWLQGVWGTTKPEEKVRLLSNPSSLKQEARRAVPGREIRAVPKGFSFASTIWVTGDYIVLISTRTKMHYAIELRDPVFSASLRDVFRLVWHFAD